MSTEEAGFPEPDGDITARLGEALARTVRTKTVHALPGRCGVTPCCGRTLFELPQDERVTSDPGLVTCTGRDASHDRAEG